MDISSKIAQGLLSIGAVFLRPQEPFIWASGIKSPILRLPPHSHRSRRARYGRARHRGHGTP